MSYDLIPSDRAPGLHVAPDTEIPADAEIAPPVTIHAGVRLGRAIRVEQGAVLGRPQLLDERSRSPRRQKGAVTLVADGCHIGGGTVLVAGATLGARTHVGDHALVREAAVIGAETMIGHGCTVSRDTVIGDRVRVLTGSIIGPLTTLGDDVFVGTTVSFLSDGSMGRRSDGARRAIRVGRAARIGSGSIVIPPLEIGEEAVVGALTLLRADVPPRTVVGGMPARTLRAVGDDELLSRD